MSDVGFVPSAADSAAAAMASAVAGPPASAASVAAARCGLPGVADAVVLRIGQSLVGYRGPVAGADRLIVELESISSLALSSAR